SDLPRGERSNDRLPAFWDFELSLDSKRTIRYDRPILLAPRVAPAPLHHSDRLIGSQMQECSGNAWRVLVPDLTTRTSPMSSQADVRSIDELKNFRVALALYGEDTLGTLGAVEAEVRRTLRWLQEERPVYWQDQIKRR